MGLPPSHPPNSSGVSVTPEGSLVSLEGSSTPSIFPGRSAIPALITGLRKMGVDLRPQANSFLRFYPPLRELPEVQGAPPEALMQNAAPAKFSLFVYVPFCASACSFCSYPKRIRATPAVVDSYLTSLEKQVAISAKPFENSSIVSVYIGGGTPSYLDVTQIRRLFANLRKFKFGKPVPVTFEVNPQSITPEKLAALVDLGVGRISMGVQSVDDRVLRTMRRNHTFSHAAEKIKMLKDSGLTFNLDFIYEDKDFEVEPLLRFLEETRPPSVTFYQRWFGFKDKFGDSHIEGSDEGATLMAGFQLRIAEAMHHLAYSRDGLFRFVKEDNAGCSYCRAVWDDSSCLALGPSAYSHLNGLAAQNIVTLEEFQETLQRGQLPYARLKLLSPIERATRALLLGLKAAGTAECGIDITAIENRYGVVLTDPVKEVLGAIAAIGAMKWDSRLTFSEQGVPFAEAILRKLTEMQCFLGRS
jgi:oxygen-independent coproporphyrinogen III oxidase